MNPNLEDLKKITLFSEFSESELECVNRLLFIKKVGPEEFVYLNGNGTENIYFITSGHVKISVFSPDGREVILEMLESGGCFGLLSFGENSWKNESAQVLKDVAVIYGINKNDILNLMNSIPKLGQSFVNLLSDRMKKIESRYTQLIFNNVKERIIGFIKYLAKHQSTKVGSEIMIKHSLTHEDIAKITSTTRQSVTSVINDLKSKNLIFSERGKFIIRDLNKL